ncbi:MAG: hypothetical protein AAFQ65_08925 [Myxococcota bacterium]
MTSYLASGWFKRDGKRSLRTEVIDGAMDVAGMLARAEVPAHVLMRVALRVRGLVAIADPQMVGIARFAERERSRIQRRLEKYTDTSPELHAFVADCLERIDNVSDMMAFYLHLIHVARMMQLLDVAMHDSLMEQVRGSISPATTKRRTGGATRKTKSATKKKTVAKKKSKSATKKKTVAKKKSKSATKKKTTAAGSRSKKTTTKKQAAKKAKTGVRASKTLARKSKTRGKKKPTTPRKRRR